MVFRRQTAQRPVVVARLFGLGRVGVRGTSMEPTLREGDALLVRWGGRVKPGRVVVVRLPGRLLEPVPHRLLAVKRAFRRTPEGWWVERDNPRSGVDSWQVGAIPEADVLGVVLLRYWPRPVLFRRWRLTGRPG